MDFFFNFFDHLYNLKLYTQHCSPRQVGYLSCVLFVLMTLRTSNVQQLHVH